MQRTTTPIINLKKKNNDRIRLVIPKYQNKTKSQERLGEGHERILGNGVRRDLFKVCPGRKVKGIIDVSHLVVYSDERRCNEYHTMMFG